MRNFDFPILHKPSRYLREAALKNIWKGIKQIVSLKSKSSSIPSKILTDNSEITDVPQIANSFNIFFTNIANNLANNIIGTDISPMSFMSEYHQVNSFFLIILLLMKFQ